MVYTVEALITWDDHGCLSLYVLLFPGTLVELLLPQRNLVGLHMASLGILRHTTGHQVTFSKQCLLS